MSHGPEHEIEHAEHAVHATHDEFNRRVTMSIAIVAAVLACVAMLSHRAHNETLGLQGEAMALRTQASIKSTEAANKWAYYQSKNTAKLLSEIVVDMLDVLPIPRNQFEEDKAKAIIKRYEEKIAHYKEEKLPKEKEAAEKLDKDALEKIKESEEKIEESHVQHRRAERFDYGELGLQLGVVLCSLAILTRGRTFWFVGIISSAFGAAFALTGLFLGGH